MPKNKNAPDRFFVDTKKGDDRLGDGSSRRPFKTFKRLRQAMTEKMFFPNGADVTVTGPVATPFLKWAGGKRQLLPEIRKHVPEKFGTYFEPFLGGGAVFFDLVAAQITGRARLGDSNAELIDTYKTVCGSTEKLIEALHAHAKQHSAAHYLAVRAARAFPGVTRAARMIYLNRTGFNGLYRVNKKGGFNVPFGKYTNPTICNEEGLRACSAALKNADIVCCDFEALTVPARRGDFVYFDPPYVPVSATSDFVGFTADGFGLADQERLVECARKLKNRGVHVLLSNADVPLVRKLYKGFEMRKVKARRNINSKGEKRGSVSELLIW